MATPNAAALGKYGDVPVNSNKGVPSIGIPIYQAKEGPLTLPIALNYHAGGIKLGEMASWVGLGWSLSAGGMITRTVQGLPDDNESKGGYYYTGNDPIRFDDYVAMKAIADNARDSEPDLFAISLNGYTGKFYIDHNRQVQLVPHQDIRITVIPGNNGFETFVLEGADGTRYIFGKDPTGRQPAAIESTIPTGGVSGYPSSWYLLRMESQDRYHEITFDYEADRYGYRTLAACKFVGGNNGDSGGVQCPTGSDDGIHYYTRTSIDGFRLAAVNTTRARIEFSAVTDRLDLDGSDAGATNKNRLDAIKVNSGEFCKTFVFNYDYFEDSAHQNVADGKRLRLTSLQEKSCDFTEVVPPYTFSYYGTTNLPYRLSKQTDHWGYYNGAAGNDNLQVAVPPTDYYIGSGGNVIYDTYGQADKASNSSYMVKGTLQKITYPTGGYTEYTLEANKVDGYRYELETKLDLSADGEYECQNGSGDYDEAEEVVTFYDEIIVNEPNKVIAKFNSLSLYCSSNQTATVEALLNGETVGFRRRFYPPAYGSDGDECSLNDFFSYTFQDNVAYTFKVTAANARAEFDIKVPVKVPALIDVGGLRVTQVTSHTGGRSVVKQYDYTVDGLGQQQSSWLYNQHSYGGNINGTVLVPSSGEPGATVEVGHSSTVFFEHSIVPLSSFQGSHIGYSHIRETIKDGTTNAGWTQREYFVSSTYENRNWYPSVPYQIDLSDGKLKASSIHNQQAELVASNTMDPSISNSTYYVNDERELFKFSPLAGYYYVERYKLRSGAYLPKLEVNMRDGVTTTAAYTYNSNPVATHLLPIAVEITHSDGRKTRTVYTYSIDPKYNGVEVYDTMTNRNIIVPVNNSVFVEGELIDGNQTDYQLYGSHPYPGVYHRYEATWNTEGALVGNLEPITTVGHYTYGYPATIQKRGWEPDHLIWTEDGLLEQRTYQNFIWKYKYINGTNLLERVTDVDEQFVDYSYDALMRLQTVTPTGSGSLVEQQTTYDYTYDGQDPVRPGNYVKTHTVYTPQPEALPYSGLADLESYQYLDGLGRPLQTVLAGRSAVEKASGEGYQDQIVDAVEYDQVGRPYKRFAPFLGGSGNGHYVDPAAMDFTETEYYADPLGRVRAVTPPDWDATLIEYASNDITITHPGTGHVYAPGSLFKTTTTDPEGLATATFTDSWGRGLLTRKYGRTENLLTSTFTEYDAKNRITKVYPPGADSNTSDLVYKYSYDGRDNLTGKKLPDRLWEYYFYDQRNLPTFASMPSLPGGSEWLVTVHDVYGRPTHSGFGTIKPDDNAATPEDITQDMLLSQTTFGTGGYLINKPIEERTWEMEGELPTGRMLTNTPGYDAFGRIIRTSTNSLLSDEADAEVNEFVFDPLGQAVYTHHTVQNPIGTVETFTNSYTDHAGRILQEAHKFMRNGEQSNYTTVARYSYDAKGQIAWEKLGGIESQPLQTVDFTYLANGWLDRINDPLVPGDDLFALNIHYQDAPAGTGVGGLSNGNISALTSYSPGSQAFMQAFEYNELNQLEQGYYHASVNGPRDSRYATSYRYDDRGNLTTLDRNGRRPDGTYGEIDRLTYHKPVANANTNKIGRIVEGSTGEAYQPGFDVRGSDQVYGYDESGNLTEDPSRALSIQYNYLNLPHTFSNAEGGQSVEITYSSTGQKLAERTFNTSGTGSERTRTYLGDMEFEAGVLVLARHARGRVSFTTTCQRELQVTGPLSENQTFQAGRITSDAVLQAGSSTTFNFEETATLLPGFQAVSGSSLRVSPGPCEYILQYEYVLSDHLGNARVLFADVDKNGTVSVDEVLAEHHYYPFGMEMEGAWSQSQPETEQRYRYNGKELNEELGLYDYGARCYDPAIGRFSTVDPLAGQFAAHSPYHYSYNNPILYIDPDGRSAYSPIFGEDGQFLGTDSEGFSGEIVIMNEDRYNAYTNGGTKTLDHAVTEVIIEVNNPAFGQSLDNYLASGFEATNEADVRLVENVLTNLVDAAHAEGLIDVSSADFAGGKVNLDLDVDYAGDAAANSTRSGGVSRVSALLKSVSLDQYHDKQKSGTTPQLWYLGNSGDAINILGIHEPLHGKYPSRGSGPNGHGGMNREILRDPKYRPALNLASDAYLSKVKAWANGK